MSAVRSIHIQRTTADKVVKVEKLQRAQQRPQIGNAPSVQRRNTGRREQQSHGLRFFPAANVCWSAGKDWRSRMRSAKASFACSMVWFPSGIAASISLRRALAQGARSRLDELVQVCFAFLDLEEVPTDAPIIWQSHDLLHHGDVANGHLCN